MGLARPARIVGGESLHLRNLLKGLFSCLLDAPEPLAPVVTTHGTVIGQMACFALPNTYGNKSGGPTRIAGSHGATKKNTATKSPVCAYLYSSLHWGFTVTTRQRRLMWQVIIILLWTPMQTGMRTSAAALYGVLLARGAACGITTL